MSWITDGLISHTQASNDFAAMMSVLKKYTDRSGSQFGSLDGAARAKAVNAVQHIKYLFDHIDQSNPGAVINNLKAELVSPDMVDAYQLFGMINPNDFMNDMGKMFTHGAALAVSMPGYATESAADRNRIWTSVLSSSKYHDYFMGSSVAGLSSSARNHCDVQLVTTLVAEIGGYILLIIGSIAGAALSGGTGAAVAIALIAIGCIVCIALVVQAFDTHLSCIGS